MYESRTTYHTFWVAFVEDAPSLLSTYRLARDAARQASRRPRLAKVFVVLVMVYVLVFPTLASSMTGYRPNAQGFINDGQNNLIPCSSFAEVAYIIHNGQRVNLSLNHAILFVELSRKTDRSPIKCADTCYPSAAAPLKALFLPR